MNSAETLSSPKHPKTHLVTIRYRTPETTANIVPELQNSFEAACKELCGASNFRVCDSNGDEHGVIVRFDLANHSPETMRRISEISTAIGQQHDMTNHTIDSIRDILADIAKTPISRRPANNQKVVTEAPEFFR